MVTVTGITGYTVGDLVWCPPSGMHQGKRLGRVKRVDTTKSGFQCRVVLVTYIDYFELNINKEPYFQDAYVRPLKKIKWQSKILN